MASETPVAPLSTSGTAAAPCKCGAAKHPTADRCTRGHVLQGNTAALVTGARSAAFWAHAEAAQTATVRAIVRDAGFMLDDAPEALRQAAVGLGQAIAIRDSAYLRLVAEGGPLTTGGRTRRAFAAWQAATDRVDRACRLLGLSRAARPVPSFADFMATLADAESQSPVEAQE